MKLEQMYQEIILDHYRNPHRQGLREPFDAESYQINPTCGDEVTLRVALEAKGVAVACLYGQARFDAETERMRFQTGVAPAAVLTIRTSISLPAGAPLPGDPTATPPHRARVVPQPPHPRSRGRPGTRGG